MSRGQEVKDFLAAFQATSKMVEDRRWHDILEAYYNKKKDNSATGGFDYDAARRAAGVGNVSTGAGGGGGGGAAAGVAIPPEGVKKILDENVPESMRPFAYQMASKESSFKPDVSSPTGCRGLFQFSKGTGGHYGIYGEGGDQRGDPVANTKAFVKLTQDNAAYLKDKLGREPTWAELAMAHQQGAGGAVKLIRGETGVNQNNLAVNGVPAGSSPQQAAAHISKFYGVPNTPWNQAMTSAEKTTAETTAQPMQNQPPRPSITTGPVTKQFAPTGEPEAAIPPADAGSKAPNDVHTLLPADTGPPGLHKDSSGKWVGADGTPAGADYYKDGVHYRNTAGAWAKGDEPAKDKPSADSRTSGMEPSATGAGATSLKPKEWDTWSSSKQQSWLARNGTNPEAQKWLKDQGITETIPVTQKKAEDTTQPQNQQVASATQNDATPTGEKSSYVPDITKGAIPETPVTPGSNPLADAGASISKGLGSLGSAVNPQSWKLSALAPDPSFGQTDTVDQTDKSDTTDQTPAIPTDDSSFSLFGAKGGLIQRVEHMAGGGTAGDDDEEEDTSSPEKIAQTATGVAPPSPAAEAAPAAPAAPSAGAASAVPAGGAQPQASPDDPITALGNAIKGALSGIQDTLGLGGAVHPGADAHHAAAKTLEKGNGALDDKTYHATMNAVDKDGQLPGAIANAYALTKAYEYHMEHGDAAKAKAAATDLVFYLKQKAAYFGDQAVKETDPVKRAQLVNAALNQVPSTNETTATPATDGSGGGTFTVKDPKTGEIITQGPYTPQMLLAAAMKMKDGSGYYSQLLENSGQQPKRDPAAERAAALKQKEAADAAEEKRVADARRAFDTDGAPAAAAPAEGAPAAAPAAAPSAIPPAVTAPAPGAPAPGPQAAAVPPVTPPTGAAIPTFAMNDQTAAAAPAPAAPPAAPYQAPTPAAAAGPGAIPTMAQNIQPAPSAAAPPAPAPSAAAPAAAAPAPAPTAAADLPDLPGKPEAPTPEEIAMSKRSADILKGMSPQKREQWNALDKDNQKDVQSRHILAVKEAKDKVDAFNTWQEKNDAAKQKALAGLKANPEGEYDPREDAAQKQNATDAYDSWEADQKADPAKAAELAKIPPVVKRQTLDLVTHALRANSSLTAEEALDFAHNVIQPVSPVKPGDIKAMPHGGVEINMDGHTVVLSKDGTATMMKLKKKLFDDYVAKQKTDAEAAEKEKLKQKAIGDVIEGASNLGSGSSMAKEAGETVSRIGSGVSGYWDAMRGFFTPKPGVVAGEEKGFALPPDAQSAYTGQEQEPAPGMTKQPSQQATRFLGVPY
jgi:hypothetical protein